MLLELSVSVKGKHRQENDPSADIKRRNHPRQRPALQDDQQGECAGGKLGRTDGGGEKMP